MSEANNETYLGDAVYASYDGYHIKLRTGDYNNQVIYLEPSVYEALVCYVEKLSATGPRADIRYDRFMTKSPLIVINGD